MIPKPNIVDAKLRFSGTLSALPASNFTKLVQHHMAHPSWTLQDVHNYHRDVNKWFGIGYSFWIAFDGTIYLARGFSQGAHTAGFNTNSLGIGFQGDFSYQNMTDAQLKSAIELNAWLMQECNGLKVSDVIGHSDLTMTSCPAKNYRMTELRNGIKDYIELHEKKKIVVPRTGLFRVRLTRDLPNTQIGAYSIYDNAVEAADIHGAVVLDEKFNVIYTAQKVSVQKPKEEEKPKEDTIFDIARKFVIENGISDGSNPKDPTTREQTWVMIYNAIKFLKK